MDTVRLVVEDYRGKIREAAVVAPTHPLRALWHLAWSLLGAAWVRETTRAGKENVGPARDALLHGLSSLNFPAMLPVSDGRVFTAVDNIHPFWPLYAPAGEEDPRGLLGDVCAALGVPEPTIGGAAVTGGVLASRIERYLMQHPYVRTLTINAFNPGRANVLADALAALQRQEAFQDLRYDVRLFVPDPNAPGSASPSTRCSRAAVRRRARRSPFLPEVASFRSSLSLYGPRGTFDPRRTGSVRISAYCSTCFRPRRWRPAGLYAPKRRFHCTAWFRSSRPDFTTAPAALGGDGSLATGHHYPLTEERKRQSCSASCRR